jgi:TrmH family RNA methyltransferase
MFEKIINLDNCDRLIGLANFLDTCVELANDKNLSFVLLAECIEKPGNLGELIRPAEYAGIDFLFFCDPVTDIFNPNIVPSSQGVVFSTNIIVTDNESAFSLLRKNNVNLLAIKPGVDDNYFNESFTQNCEILVDAEHSLLSNFWLKKDDAKKILLPQSGVCDS